MTGELETIDRERQRIAMIADQIVARGIADARVLQAIADVPRERFVPEELAEFAYEDRPLPIEAGQTISQPYIVALMLEAAEIGPEDRILEIGVGSGYAAAVMSRLARRVHAIDRHAELADRARERMARLGYDNVVIRTGDGTRGWPENAPYDVILVAAGGPLVPQPLLDQLAVGGRLVIPVGAAEQQQLVRVTRSGATGFETEDLGPVHFVPLIGEHGWSSATRDLPAGEAAPAAILAAASEPLPAIDDPAFAEAFDRFADARIVLLGEASHGTSEFYRARAAITRRLIERHGFTVVAVEADWPDGAAIDRYVRHRPAIMSPEEPPFQRFPTWMWRNREVAAFANWLRQHNESREPSARAGFFGLDLYSLHSSIRAVLAYLDRVDPEAAAVARERYSCLGPFGSDPASYGRMAISAGYEQCAQAVVEQLRYLLEKARDYAAEDGEDFLDATQNARLIANAEAYYRAIYYGAAESWNLRDRHMFDTLELLLHARGEKTKAVVWAHNSHIGDARATEMGQSRGELNIGQLCREEYGHEACLIGFGTHSGTVMAATNWGGEMQVKRVNPSRPGSYEALFHDSGHSRALLDLREGERADARAILMEPRLERFIGVIYRPDTERWSHYASASLPEQFDAWVWFDETMAVDPIGDAHMTEDLPDTYPFGL